MLKRSINTHKGEQEALRKFIEKHVELIRAKKEAGTSARTIKLDSRRIELPVANLTDKSYEKRKLGGIEVEAITKLIGIDDEEGILRLVDKITTDLLGSSEPYYKEGGAMALSGVAVALGTAKMPSIFDLIIQPIIDVLKKEKSIQTKFYALEALYNVMKVSKGHIFPMFCVIFEICCRLISEKDATTKSAVSLVDSLLKDIFTEFYEPGKIDMRRFVAILNSHVRTTDPTARQFIISWITLLESLPSVNLLSYSTLFIGGLLEYLADPLRGISSSAASLLAFFERDIAQKRIPSIDYNELTTSLCKQIQLITNKNLFASATANATTPTYYNRGMTRMRGFLRNQPRNARAQRGMQNRTIANTQRTHAAGNSPLGTTSVSIVKKKSEKLNLILVTAMQWLETLVDTAREEIVDRMSSILSVILPYFSDKHNKVSNEAAALNQQLLLFVKDTNINSPDGYISAILRAIDNKVVVSSRLAGLTWMALFKRKFGQPPPEYLDGVRQGLLRLLSDPSEDVMLLAVAVLEMFADDDDLFYKEMTELMNIFSREAMGKRGAKVLQHFCKFLPPERVYLVISEMLIDVAKERNSYFMSDIVQTLNLLLLSLEETRPLRLILRNNPPQKLFETMYRAWAYSPSSLFTFCLLCQKYTHAYDLVKEL